MKKEGEFGKGFIYNLILFAKHWGKAEGILRSYKRREISEKRAYLIWFTAASDHFCELDIPNQWRNKKIGIVAEWLKNRSLHLGHDFREEATQKDFEKVFEKLEELAMLIDKELGVKTIKASRN
jgi:hypothetical protein